MKTSYEAPDTLAKASRGHDDYNAEAFDLHGERMTLNMGPSHPATHGVLRLILELDGETIISAEPDVGFLHRGDEKIAENMHYNQFIPYTDRLPRAPREQCRLRLCRGKTHGLGVATTRSGLARALLRTRTHFCPHARSRCLRDGRRRDDCFPLHLHRT